jgi:biotin carboxyl carrier protein
MRIKVSLENKDFEVDIQKAPYEESVDHVVINGRTVEIAHSRDWLRHLSKNLIIGDHSYQVEFEYDQQGIPNRVTAVGQSVDVTVDFPGKGKLKRPDMVGMWGEGDQIRAPLPGRIVAIKVRVGDNVEAGQLLGMLDAMKMENELVCPRDGVIKEILVKEGQAVELDQVLVTLE